MKYEVKAKVIIKIIVDADDEDVAAEMADNALGDAYDDYYEIETVTRLEDENVD